MIMKIELQLQAVNVNQLSTNTIKNVINVYSLVLPVPQRLNVLPIMTVIKAPQDSIKVGILALNVNTPV